MDIRIIKGNVRYCSICDSVSELKNSWEEGQELLRAEDEEYKVQQFPGVAGYIIKDSDEYKYGTTEICEKCMHAINRGVALINNQKLSGVSIDTNK